MRSSALADAAFVRRLNRFALEATVEGRLVRAWLPSSARLTDLLVPEAALVLEASGDPRRRTAWTVHRVRHRGVWVGIRASGANDLVERWLEREGGLPGIGPVAGWTREVTLGAHRLDFRLERPGGGAVLLEVKSLSVAMSGSAVFSRTPSTRGVGHLELLSRVARDGSDPVDSACCFVVQRPDVDRLVVDPAADPGWVEAVRRAAAAGVRLVALRCRVDRAAIEIECPIPIDLAGRPHDR